MKTQLETTVLYLYTVFTTHCINFCAGEKGLDCEVEVLARHLEMISKGKLVLNNDFYVRSCWV